MRVRESAFTGVFAASVAFYFLILRSTGVFLQLAVLLFTSADLS